MPKIKPSKLIEVKGSREDKKIPQQTMEVTYRLGFKSTYNPEEDPQIIIEMGKSGKTNAAMAARLGISLRTLYDWMDNYPDFKEAHDIAKAHAQAFHEERADKYMIEYKDGPKLNTGLYKFIMMGSFKETYNVGHEFTISAKDDVHTISTTLRDSVAALEEKIRDKKG